MKKRGLPVKPSVYTSLFNSCSNSPFPSDGLTRTRKLFALMIEKDILPNQITCHSIIKGKYQTAVRSYQNCSKYFSNPFSLDFFQHLHDVVLLMRLSKLWTT